MRYMNELISHFDECVSSNNNHYVVWSGGADSTCVLMMLCRALSKASNNKPINVLSVKSDVMLGRIKSRKEAEAREKILTILKYNYNVQINVHEIVIDYNGKNDPAKNTGLPQAALWAMTSLPYVPNDSNLYFGYIRGDDLVYYRGEFNKTLKSMIALIGKENITIEAPLMMYDKSDVFYLLKQDKILDYIWTCEMPTADGEPCGCCVPCSHHYEAMVMSELDGMSARDKHELITIIRNMKNRMLDCEPEVDVGDKVEIVDTKQAQCDVRRPSLANGIYRHFKGDRYKVICVAKDATDTAENHGRHVVYQSISTGEYYTREYNEFTSPVDKVKYPDVEQYERFRPEL